MTNQEIAQLLRNVAAAFTIKDEKEFHFLASFTELNNKRRLQRQYLFTHLSDQNETVSFKRLNI